MSLRLLSTVRSRSIVAASVPKPTYSANVHSWIEILLAGTPRPAQSGAWADAVPVVPSPKHGARAATMMPRRICTWRLDVLAAPPSLWVGEQGRRRASGALALFDPYAEGA